MKRILLLFAFAYSVLPAYAADVQAAAANCGVGPNARSQTPAQEAADARNEASSGEYYYHQSEMPLAITAFKRALQLDLCNSRAHYYLWRLDTLGGNIADAHRHLEYAHQLSPDDGQIQRTWTAVQYAIQLENEPNGLQVRVLDMPHDRFFAKMLGYDHFFAKTLDCDGIPVRSAAVVDSDALVLACAKIRLMLQNLPDAQHRMAKRGAELHIIGEFQGTTDLPENAHWRNSKNYRDAQGDYTDMNARTRGVGGLLSSCGEENLLHLPGDRYHDGYDICTHEFAHDIMSSGLTDKQHSAIEKRYEIEMRQGLWKDAYAATNSDEYWAELSMWYFGSRGTYPGRMTSSGPDALRAYDPGGFALLESIYGAVGGSPGK